MGKDEVDQRIKGVFALHLDVDAGCLSADTRLGEDLCVDSLTAVELLMVLEDEFDIALPEDEVGELRTYADVVDVVADRLATRA